MQILKITKLKLDRTYHAFVRDKEEIMSFVVLSKFSSQIMTSEGKLDFHNLDIFETLREAEEFWLDKRTSWL